MKLVVHLDVCESNGLCQAAAPELFELGDDDFLTVLNHEPGPDQEQAARNAVRECPKQAISIQE